MIRFHEPSVAGRENDYIAEAILSGRLCGGNHFTKRSEDLLKGITRAKFALLTPSCTAALELAALLINVREGDEVIIPSYTFVSTANAFVLRGARVVFVDIRPDTLNIDESKIEAAITPRTKAIVPVHYAGVSCEMDTIMRLAKHFKLIVIEDAAQAICSDYRGKALGTIGHFGAFSFHETKNITSGGEGGALLGTSIEDHARAEILREKGTNRSQFFRGDTDKYTWMDLGSSYLPSEIQAAYLTAQLEAIEPLQTKRMSLWERYSENLKDLARVRKPIIPEHTVHNAHMYYILCSDLEERQSLITYLRSREVTAVFHYVPLHSSPAGRKFGRFSGPDENTTRQSERIVRLPLYNSMTHAEVDLVCDVIRDFYRSR